MDARLCTKNRSPFRHPNTVMNPGRLGAMHQSRLSFVRSLIRRMAKQQWTADLSLWNMSAQGFGTVIYRLDTPNHHYHLVIFCDEISDEERNDRVIAEKWDVTFAFVKGSISSTQLAQLRHNVPRQEAGRNNSQVLVLARANKSVRVFEHLVASLAKGQQPDPQILATVGYILRTTAVYGNGKFGIADFELLQANPDFNLSFSAQMCAVYLLRQFSIDWVHYLAQQRGGNKAAFLSRPLQRYLGIGNATGLGMAPYLINHPRIVDQWLSVREQALAEIVSYAITEDKCNQINLLLSRAAVHLQQVITIDEHQQQLNKHCVGEIQAVIEQAQHACLQQWTWKQLIEQSEQYSMETQEVILSCLLELYPEQVDQHENNMNTDETLSLTPGITVADAQQVLTDHYQWALAIDFSQPENCYWFWYRSEDKEEPRLGIRGNEPGEERELPLDIGRQVYRFHQALINEPETTPLSEFLLQHPQYRSIARRVWTMGRCIMGDIQINVLSKDALPMHLLRCKLAMFGATKFDPRSDRWVRVTLFQGAPLLDELHENEWLFPLLPDTEGVNNTHQFQSTTLLDPAKEEATV
ncbi:hypothetical protein [Spartinivicinus marinus]|uniref:hypothetical protein n=1 Tax=Spartinivicinus marinus TaxID=2994442 RepID=UPI001C5CC15C|nr:hypothetical protein [Spartinivicinus marinus]MCX4026364.1 hypothetical protein [Spartinivicinus marinus]